ncbi:hypothetical protein F0U60_42915 [Archangium minus]|uniref:Uncharacterized protein n=1 Tax=Archangium minus TaxID=83450 RepID=A0ABY9X412_9BACT|nr:hypothetical protein F0U60_42915 [Archangium minus]
MKFFIIAEDEGLPSAFDFTSSLNARWPGATVKQISNPERNYALEFYVPMADSRLEGLLHKKRGSMTFEGVPLREVSEFVQWCRSLVPSHVSLLFCDESMNGEVKVTPAMTAEQILEAFHASGG